MQIAIGKPCAPERPAGGERGFSILELVVVLLIGMVLTAMALPQVRTAAYRYRLQGAIASATWAIQSTRYQALMEGYPYEVVLTTSSTSSPKYQIENEPNGSTSFSNVGSSVPLSGSKVVLNQNTTLQFKPNGFVSAPVGALTFTLTYQGLCQTVTVSNYANITLSTISSSCS